MITQPFEILKIENDDDLILAFKLLESVFQAKENTQEAEKRNYLVKLIEDYENKNYPI